MPCHALRASCFIDPWGVVYPCITYSRPLGRLRDTGMRLEPIWNDARNRAASRARSGRGSARSAGPPVRRIRASSATAWRFVGRRRLSHIDGRRAPGADRNRDDERRLLRGRLDAVPPGPGGDASRRRRRVGRHRGQAGGAEHRRRHRSHPALRERDRRRRRALDRRHRGCRGTDAAPACCRTAAAARGRRSAGPSRTSRRPSRSSWMPTDRTIPKIFRCWSSRSWRGMRITSSASRLRGGSSELHGGFDEFLRLAGSSFITACINWRFNCQLSDSQNGFRAVRTSVLRQLDLRENTTTIEQEMTIKTLRQGWRMAEVPSHEHPAISRRVSHPRLARRAAVRLFARQVPVLLSGPTVNILGIWDGHDSGAALLAGRAAAIRRQRRAPEPSQARDRVSGPVDCRLPRASRARPRAD